MKVRQVRDKLLTAMVAQKVHQAGGVITRARIESFVRKLYDEHQEALEFLGISQEDLEGALQELYQDALELIEQWEKRQTRV